MRAGFGVSMQGQGGGGTADPKEWLWALAVAQPHTALGKSKAGFRNCGDAHRQGGSFQVSLGNSAEK